MEKLILGIETSCDDTSLALLQGSVDQNKRPPRILSLLNFSQEKLFEKWGGVVPEIASRNHLEKLIPLLQKIFQENHNPEDLDAIAVTTTPGLIGPLLTGLNMAKTLALLFKLPLLSVNHLYAHLEAVHLDHTVSYPYIGVLISGGHGFYALVSSPKDFEILGETLDDAPGEAFDKGGKMLGLPYPAGKIIDELAKTGDPDRYPFPVCLKNRPDANLSFSGVKTALSRFLLEKRDIKKELPHICASYQKAIIDALELKLAGLMKDYNLPVVVGGGVACNHELRKRFKKRFSPVYFVSPSLCTDNGAMIANYAFRNWKMAVPFPQCLKLDAKNRFTQNK